MKQTEFGDFGEATSAGARSPALRRLVFGLVLVGLVVGGYFAFPYLRAAFFSNKADDPKFVLAPVKKGRFVLTVTERGTVSSLKNSTLSSNVQGTTTIIFIVPEGTDVKAPVVSRISGHVSEIEQSEDGQDIVVEPDPLVIRTPWSIIYYPGTPVVYHVPPGKYTQVLVEPGDRVRSGDYLAGDVVCELDSSSLVEKEKQQQIAVTQAAADLEKGRKNVEIQINQNQSDLAAAKLNLDLARLDLKKFVEGERNQQLNELRGDVLIAQEELTQAEEVYRFYQRIAKKGYKSQVELETARVAVVKAKNKLAVAQEKLKVLQDYTFERTYKELQEKADEAERELKRVRLQGLAALAQYKAELQARQLTYSVELEKLRRLQRQIKACKLVAPQNGKVVYANQRSRRSEPVVIEEGVQVRERQKIINLPDFSQMKVEVKIVESKISNVREGLRAEIRVDALPERIFTGIVEVVPDVPVKGEYPNYDLMLFETVVRITDTNLTGLKPGMNANVEIIADERDDVLQAPVQSIVSIGDSYVAFVYTENGPELRKDIRIGASNDKTVEIVGGLKEGERVIMNPKTHFRRKITELRALATEKLEQAAAKRDAARKRRAARKRGTKGRRKKRPAGSQWPPSKRPVEKRPGKKHPGPPSPGSRPTADFPPSASPHRRHPLATAVSRRSWLFAAGGC